MNILTHLSLICLVISLRWPSNSIAQDTAATKYFFAKTKTQIKPFSLQTARNGQLVSSNLEQFRDLLASTKIIQTQKYFREYKVNYKTFADSGKVQQQIDGDKPFPCGINNSRSAEPPTSVHRLRPGDIDIIGAMGDSLTAGMAMMSNTFAQFLIEFRGQATLGGGLQDWRTFLTLPNIIKVFNPNLYGYAVANTLAKFREARFNVAESFAITQDMPYMAEVLVKRMQTDANVNMAKHWKMISILIGANDICNNMCYYDKIEDYLESRRNDLHKTLTILRDNIKRLMVNIILIPNIDNFLGFMRNTPAYCNATQKFGCGCLLRNSLNSTQMRANHDIIQRIQQIDIEVASLPEFQLDEFAVVPRAVGLNSTMRSLKDGSTDMKFLAIDCFHFSQYGNAAFSTMLWNEMLQVKIEQPPTTILRPFELFVCPSEEKPYISTLRNS